MTKPIAELAAECMRMINPMTNSLVGRLDEMTSGELAGRTDSLPRPANADETEGNPMTKGYLEQMRAHVDEGGKLSHQNGVELLAEVERLRAEGAPLLERLAIVFAPDLHWHGPDIVKIIQAEYRSIGGGK